MPSGHTVVAFDTELATLHRKIAEMGGLAEEQLNTRHGSLLGFPRRESRHQHHRP